MSVSFELTLIRNVSFAIRRIITDNVEGLDENTIVFDSPADIQDTADNIDRLSLFLYRISENTILKNEDDFQRTASNTLEYPPLVLDLQYLLTPFGGGDERRATEQMILTRVMIALHDNAIMSGTILGDNLLNSGNRELKILLNNQTMEEVNHIWSMFPGRPYRLGISYTITPLRIPSRRILETQRVLTKDMRYVALKKTE